MILEITLAAAATACVMMGDLTKKMPDGMKWTGLTERQTVFLEGIWAINPETPPGLPDGDQAWLGTIEGSERGMVIFTKNAESGELEVCGPPMEAPGKLRELIDKVQEGKGDKL